MLTTLLSCIKIDKHVKSVYRTNVVTVSGKLKLLGSLWEDKFSIQKAMKVEAAVISWSTQHSYIVTLT